MIFGDVYYLFPTAKSSSCNIHSIFLSESQAFRLAVCFPSQTIKLPQQQRNFFVFLPSECFLLPSTASVGYNAVRASKSWRWRKQVLLNAICCRIKWNFLQYVLRDFKWNVCISKGIIRQYCSSFLCPKQMKNEISILERSLRFRRFKSQTLSLLKVMYSCSSFFIYTSFLTNIFII